MQMNNQRAYRLPSFLRPSLYKIELDVNPGKTEFHGKVWIELESDQPHQHVEIHAQGLHFENVKFLFPGQAPVEGTATLFPEQQMATLTPKGAKVPQGAFSLQIEYIGTLTTGMHGLYLAKDHQEQALCTQCEPTSARQIFPCFDEPAFKASLEWTLHTPKSGIALTNAPLLKMEEREEKRTWFFEKTRKISSYLAALVVGDFESEDPTKVHEVPIRVYALRGKKDQTQFAIRWTTKLLPFFEKYFGIAYPYKKYDQVAVPGFDAFAMENIGLVLFRQHGLLMDPKTTSLKQEKQMALVIAHEFAHMWFGNWVTMKWWDDLWLNEAFAEWMAYRATEALHPDYQVWDDFQEGYNHAMKDDALPTTHAIWTPVETPEQAIEMFDSITYEKGCAVMRMLEHFLGEETFCQGLQGYMKAFAEGNATGADLWNKLSAASGKNVVTLMQSWVAQPGFPLVSVQRMPGSEFRLALKQERFFESALDQDTKDSTLWNIPLVIRYQDQLGTHEYRYLFTQKEEEITLPSKGAISWYYANSKQIGFYRLHMDPPSLDLLLQQKLSVLSPAEQMGIIEDGFALINCGKSELSTFLKILKTFSSSKKENVLRALKERLEFLSQLIEDTGNKEVQEQFRAFIEEQFLKYWKPGSLEGITTESVAEIEYRAVLLNLLAQNAQIPTLIQEAQKLAEKEREDAKAVNPNIAGTLVNIAARFGDEAKYDQYVEVYQKRKRAQASPQEAMRYLHALSLFRIPKVTQKSFELIEQGVIPQEAVRTVVVQLMSRRHSQRAAWEYVKTHWNSLKERIGDMGFSRLVESIGNLHPDLYEDIRQFFAKNPPARAERALARGLKRIQQYKELYERLNPEVIAIFEP